MNEIYRNALGSPQIMLKFRSTCMYICAHICIHFLLNKYTHTYMYMPEVSFLIPSQFERNLENMLEGWKWKEQMLEITENRKNLEILTESFWAECVPLIIIKIYFSHLKSSKTSKLEPHLYI